MTTAKYDPQAERWTETAYADAERYLRHRADVVIALGPPLVPGDTVLDLACGDGGFGEVLRARGLRYVGVDASAPMVEAAARRLGGGVQLGDLNDFRPEAPVAATAVFRAIYYARDRLAFFRRVAEYTEKKLVFDLNPRQYRLDDVRTDLRAAGFDQFDVRPFLVPQRVALPRRLAAALEAAERTPLARVALRFRFTYVCSASRR
jgi:SAM-dependent methyltransferase